MKKRSFSVVALVLMIAAYFYFVAFVPISDVDVVEANRISESGSLGEKDSRSRTYAGLTEDERFEFIKGHIDYQTGERSDLPEGIGGFATPSQRKRSNLFLLMLRVLENGDQDLVMKLIRELPKLPKVYRDWVYVATDKKLAHHISRRDSREVLSGIDIDREDVMEILEAVEVDPEIGGAIAFSAIIELSEVDPRNALSWALTLPSDYIGPTLKFIFLDWWGLDPKFEYEVLEVISQLDETTNIDGPLAMIAIGSSDDPDLALKLSKLIRSDEERGRVYSALASRKGKEKKFAESLGWILLEMEINPKAKYTFDYTLNAWKERDPEAVMNFIENRGPSENRENSNGLMNPKSVEAVSESP